MSVSAQEHHAFLARLAKTPPSSSADVDDGIRVLKTLLGECRHLYASPLDPLRIAKAVMCQAIHHGYFEAAARWGQAAVALLMTLLHRASGNGRSTLDIDLLALQFRNFSFVAAAQCLKLQQSTSNLIVIVAMAADAAGVIVGYVSDHGLATKDAADVEHCISRWMDSCYRLVVLSASASLSHLSMAGDELMCRLLPRLLKSIPASCLGRILLEKPQLSQPTTTAATSNSSRTFTTLEKLLAVVGQLASKAYVAISNVRSDKVKCDARNGSLPTGASVLEWIQAVRSKESDGTKHVFPPCARQGLQALLRLDLDPSIHHDEQDNDVVHCSLSLLRQALHLLQTIHSLDLDPPAGHSSKLVLEMAAGTISMLLLSHASLVDASSALLIAELAISVAMLSCTDEWALNHLLVTLAGLFMILDKSSDDANYIEAVQTSVGMVLSRAIEMASTMSPSNRELVEAAAFAVPPVKGQFSEAQRQAAAEALLRWQARYSWRKDEMASCMTLHEQSARNFISTGESYLACAVIVCGAFIPHTRKSGAAARLLLPPVYYHLLGKSFVPSDCSSSATLSLVMATLLRASLTYLVFDLVRCGEVSLARSIGLWPLAMAMSFPQTNTSKAALMESLAVAATSVAQIPGPGKARSTEMEEERELRNSLADFLAWSVPRGHVLRLLHDRSSSADLGLYKFMRHQKFGVTFQARRSWCTARLDDHTRHEELPPGCIVVELLLDTRNGSLRLTRREGSAQPFSFSLSTVSDHHNVVLESVDRMRQIEIDSQDHMLRSAQAASTSSSTDREVKQRWWKERQKLDDDVAQLMGVLQSELLGEWAVLLAGSLRPCRDEVYPLLRRQIAVAAERVSRDLQRTTGVAVGTTPIIALLEGLPLIAATVHDPNPCVIPSMAAEGLGRVSSAVFASALDTSQLQCVECLADALAALVGEVAAHGDAFRSAQETDDNSVEAIAVAAAQEMFRIFSSELVEVSPLYRGAERCRRNHVYLVLDNALHGLPWETLPQLRGQSVSRVPNARYVVDAATQQGPCRVRPEHVRYELNPTGDMHRTEKRFVDFFEASFPTWRGRRGSCIGRPMPTTRECCEFLKQLHEVDMYVYVGHSTGERLVGRSVLYDACFADGDPISDGRPRRRAPTTLLMGCSSAKMSAGPTHDPYGMPMAYLHAGAPALVGCLWDVTDGEIDKLTIALLSQFFAKADVASSSLLDGDHSLSLAVALARRSCKFFYLTGGAVVMYGIPVQCRLS